MEYMEVGTIKWKSVEFDMEARGSLHVRKLLEVNESRRKSTERWKSLRKLVEVGGSIFECRWQWKSMWMLVEAKESW